MTKAWYVGPYDENWGFVVHAPTRGKAKKKVHGSFMELDDWVNIRAIRVPSLDDQIITKELMIEAGFPEEWDGEPMDVGAYISECRCELCQEAERRLEGK